MTRTLRDCVANEESEHEALHVFTGRLSSRPYRITYAIFFPRYSRRRGEILHAKYVINPLPDARVCIARESTGFVFSPRRPGDDWFLIEPNPRRELYITDPGVFRLRPRYAYTYKYKRGTDERLVFCS